MVALRFVAFVLMVAAVSSFASWTQEPAPKPASATPETSAKTIPGTPERHPLEGVFELRRRRINGRVEDQPSRGYVAITHRHLFLCLSAPGPDAERPLLRSGVRSWTPTSRKDSVDTAVKLGWFTDAEGRMHLETPGTTETRRLVLERGQLRIVQDERNELEFERIE